MKLSGRTVLITGAGRGIGFAIAEKLASEGARIVLNDLDEAVGRDAVDKLKAQGRQSVLCWGSVTDADFPARFIDTAISSFGVPDIIVNNAGYTWDAVIQKMTDEQFDAIVDVHLRAPFRILRAFAGPLREAVKREQSEGRVVYRKVVNVSSLAGTIGSAGQTNYASAKAGVIGLTKALAREWGRYNVNVNCVAFGVIDTRLTQRLGDAAAFVEVDGKKIRVGLNEADIATLTRQTPLGRTGTPAEAAGAVFLLCIPESDFITAEILVCSGGYLI
jgi:3-oxoacyl-[acyl-carrier protein] reductase